ncbi:hypothetical protein [Symbiobacterium thermophilum]|uniref:hypothetical protein n=1 Tax=Symbiobacterium thermophilum TaxID=2734 RepID=UPI00235689B2|nr:hypothetical protein [Symbiobacterium thermophilum]
MRLYPWETASRLGLARLELRQDLLRDRITPALEERFARSALDLGEDAARAVRDRFPEASLWDLAEAWGVEVSWDTALPAAHLRIRALYERTGERSRIRLNRALIAETAARLRFCLDPPPDEELVAVTALAHELFHHLEETELGLLSHRLEPVPVWKVGPWQVNRRIQRVREVGAHAFASALLGLPYLPNLWDYLLLVEEGKMDPAALWTAVQPQ